MSELACSVCTRKLPLSMFIKRPSIKRGYTYYCKDCKKIKRVQTRNGNLKVQLRYLVGTSKNSAKSRGITDYDIDVEYLEALYSKQKGLCAISGNEMTLISGKGCVATNISMDRIDNKLGYIKGNIQLVCRSVNSLKMNMGDEQFTHFMDLMAQNWIKKRNLI